MGMTLDEALHGPSALPILVKPDGTWKVTSYPSRKLENHAPESINIDWSGSWDMPDILEEHERTALASIENGWRALTGWAGPGTLFIFEENRQHFGRDLEEHITETPGLWAIASVEMHPPICEAGKDGTPCDEWTAHERCDHADYPSESQAAGRALIHKEVPEGEGI